MSHTVKIETQVRDLDAVRAACTRLGLPPPVHGEFQLFSDRVPGLGVQLSGWKYPAVFQPETGAMKFDNFKGHWGAQKELDRFLQAYAVQKARLEAHKKGYTVSEQPLTDGSIKLTVQVTGGAA